MCVLLHPHSAWPAFGQATPTLYSGPRAPASASLYLQHDLTDVLRAAPQPSGGPVMQTFADIDSYVDQKHCEGSRKHTFFFSAELELFTIVLQAWGAEQQRPSGGGDDDGGSSGPRRPRRGAAGSSSQEQGSQEQGSRVADMLRGTGYTLKWVLAAFELLVPAGGGDPLLCRRVTYKGQPTLRAMKAIEELPDLLRQEHVTGHGHCSGDKLYQAVSAGVGWGSGSLVSLRRALMSHRSPSPLPCLQLTRSYKTELRSTAGAVTYVTGAAGFDRELCVAYAEKCLTCLNHKAIPGDTHPAKTTITASYVNTHQQVAHPPPTSISLHHVRTHSPPPPSLSTHRLT